MALAWLSVWYQGHWADDLKLTEQYKDKAFEMAERAAKYTWCTEGRYYLGVCYYFGYGTAVDCELAYQWFKRAARAGKLSALYYLKSLDFLEMVN